ncbi:TIGR01440 family protein [Bacillus tuaregi]|uniref:TIGR01440 family protein n=1 Tax=Bacillus tuaregi TaxID=1816695 RepID=UPI0008F92DE5|nr:TIGR01440 family protein [Bacillus tuaregi]
MSFQIMTIQEQTQTILTDIQNLVELRKGQIFVIGCSTSEVQGATIGTSGTIDTAEILFTEFKRFQESTGVELAFQCCEHLNRALVVEREVAEKHGFELVSVVPARNAGGSMATYAYQHMTDPVVVEFIRADAGIDIGDTFIGMHLKHVAVPIRASIDTIGNAHVTLARTRPKLIGGERAVYEKSKSNKSCR